MNFGAFAGGFSQGWERGTKIGKDIREMVKEQGLREIREKGMAEAEAQRAATAASMVKENGVTGEPAAPTSGPVSTETPKVETPTTDAAAVSASSPTANPDTAGANTAAAATAPIAPATVSAASPTANPDPAAANTAATTQGAAPAKTAPVAQATPAGVAATGVTPVAKTAPPAEAPETAAPAPIQKPNGKFTVNGESYDTREQAMAAAERAAPSAVDLFVKNSSARLEQEYIKQGDYKSAQQVHDFAKSKHGEGVMKAFAKTVTAPDLDSMAREGAKLYEYIDDGVSATRHRVVTKSDGTQVATVTLKDRATGKEHDVEMTRETIMNLAASANPAEMFKHFQTRQDLAEKMKYEAKIKAEQRKADNADKKDLEGYKQDRIDEREAGKLGTKKPTDPTERRALIRSDEMKNNPKFARMSPEEQTKTIDKAMETVYGPNATKAEPSNKPAVVIADKPMTYNKELPVKYRKSDGKAFHVVDGKYIPIEGGVPSATPAPAPKAAPAPAPTPKAAPAPAQQPMAASGLPSPPVIQTRPEYGD